MGGRWQRVSTPIDNDRAGLETFSIVTPGPLARHKKDLFYSGGRLTSIQHHFPACLKFYCGVSVRRCVTNKFESRLGVDWLPSPRHCVCQCAAALPVLVDFLLLAAVEDYGDSPSLLTFSLPLALSVFLTITILRDHSLWINQGHPDSKCQGGTISAGLNKLSTSHAHSTCCFNGLKTLVKFSRLREMLLKRFCLPSHRYPPAPMWHFYTFHLLLLPSQRLCHQLVTLRRLQSETAQMKI